VDPAAIIARLKQQVRELREEVRLLRGGGPERGPLTADELGRLERDVASWVGDPSPDAALDVTGDMLWVRACELGRGGSLVQLGQGGWMELWGQGEVGAKGYGTERGPA
jgi:kinesin family protein 6/9